MHVDNRAYRPRCLICGHEQPGFMALVCQVCQVCKEAFDLVDEQTPDMSQPETRVAIGPTDV